MAEDVRLQGAITFITGAGRGIGRAIAIAVAEAGSNVALGARSIDQLEDVANLVRDLGRDATVVQLDVTSEISVKEAVAAAEEAYGRIDVLVNNAGSNNGGPNGAVGPLADINPEAWWGDITVNLYGTFLMTRAVLPRMLSRASGRIINIAAQTSTRPAPFDSAYACSKAGVVRLTDSLAAELKGSGVSVFAMSPGAVRTELVAGALETEAGRSYLGQVSSQLEKAFVEPEVPAGQVVLLAAGVADQLSGRLLRVTDDFGELASRAEEILEKDLYQLRYRT